MGGQKTDSFRIWKENLAGGVATCLGELSMPFVTSQHDGWFPELRALANTYLKVEQTAEVKDGRFSSSSLSDSPHILTLGNTKVNFSSYCTFLNFDQLLLAEKWDWCIFRGCVQHRGQNLWKKVELLSNPVVFFFLTRPLYIPCFRPHHQLYHNCSRTRP